MITRDSLVTDQYFATLPAEKLVNELLYRVEQFDEYVKNCGRLSVWQKSYAHYYQGIYKDARIQRIGEQGEYFSMPVNHFRSILINVLNMTTGQRPSFDPRAANTDKKSQSQVVVASGVLEYYNRVGKMENYTKRAVEQCEVYADSYIYQGWDFNAGNDYMADPQNPQKMLKQGDVAHKNYTPLDVIFDFTGGLLDSKRNWYILRDFENKWDLIAQFPEKKEQIMKVSLDKDALRFMRAGAQNNLSEDYVPVFRFFHSRTTSVPQGREFKFVGEGCWLTDSVLPKFYKNLPVYRLCGYEQDGSGFGYSMAFDLAPIQEAIDNLISIILTNQQTFGVQNIIVEDGANVSTQDLGDGLKVITHSSKNKEPHALELLSTPKEIFEFVSMLIDMMETVSGVNSVARGNPEASLKSGAALALVQAMAIQFVSGLQQSYAMLLEDLGTGLIEILKECATTPRMVEIAGKFNRSNLKEFKGEDLSSISRVMVDVGNPLTRTTAGKVNIADQLLGAGMVKTPEQYIQVLTTGKLEPLIEGEQAELMLIRAENEKMQDGAPAVAVATDNHMLHISEHKCVLSSPEAREDAKVVTATMDHIMQHLNLWRTTDPGMLQALGQQPPPMMAAPVPGAPEQPAGAGSVLPVNPVEGKAAEVKQPNLPKNPLTGAPAAVAAGGM